MENKPEEGIQRKKRILLVEDEAIIALMESELLQSGGYEVITALTGEQALQIFQADPSIDLVLMDIDLGPGIDGGETARRMLAQRDVPVVFISSHTEPEILARTEAITSYGYIVKGSSETAIFASLNMAFRLHAAHQELLRKKAELEELAENLSQAVNRLMETQKQLLENQQKLQKTTEHLEAILNSLPDLLFEFDENMTILEVRAPRPELLYRPREEIVGRRITDVLPEDVSGLLKYTLEEATEKGLAEIDYSLTISGKTRYFEANISRMGERQPVKNRFVALIREITDRIEAQLEQQKTEIRFCRLFQTMQEGVAIHRLLRDALGQPVDYQVVEVNKAYARHTGIPVEKAVGQKASELYGSGHPPFFQHYLESLETGQPVSFESYFEPLQRYFKITAFPMGEDLFATVFEDITDRKKAEMELREREERYRLIFENAPLGILQFDRNSVITECNEAFVRIIGSSREALIGFNILERTKDEKVKEAVREALAGRVGYYEGIYHSVTSNKSTPARGFFAGIFDPNGNFISGIGTFEDFTERYRMESALRNSEAMLQAFIESPAYSLIFLDAVGSILKFNRIASERMKSILGLELKTGEKLINLLPEEFKNTFSRNLEKVRAGEKVTVERRIQSISGEIYWYSFHMAPVYASSGELAGIFFSAEEVTERKRVEESLRQSEERFRTIFEHSGVAMLVIDPGTGNIIDANYQAESFYGYSREQLKKMNIRQINTLAPDRIQELMAGAKEKKINYFVFQHRLASGELREVEVHSYPIMFGEKKYLLSVIIDLTRRLKLEQQLKKAVEEKQAILRELQHRIKNSFALINSIINLELQRPGKKEGRARLESLKHRIFSISRVYDLLSAGERYQEISLDRLLKEISQAILRAYSTRQAVNLTLELEPVTIEVKTALPLGLIATEIITNSLKYAFSGRTEGEIRLKLKKADQQLQLEIADNGIGLPGDFFTMSSAGLGQEIIKALADQIEARLEVESRPGEGTLFRLTLPLISEKDSSNLTH
ncbi:MAG: PAS domain S-box protein [Candidatus Saccharicenans sp.]|nr:PAS domain S-box protein [Candidatus Saccharicenans sp.]